MDIDPPAQPSSTPKKLKFAPKRPTRRKPTPVLPKSDSSDDDAETKLKLLRKVNERLGSRRPKVEKKSSDNVTTSQGAGSSKTCDQPKDGNSKKGSNFSSENSLILSSSVATKDEDNDKMMVDDRSDSSSETEYKEPWDPNSYYPISLPLRPFGSGNPEVLDAKEFGEEEMEYDETKINSALELGLLGQENNEKKERILFQLPEKLPLVKLTNQVPLSSKGKEKVESWGLSKEDISNKGAGLRDLPDGYMGKMLVYKSGAVKLKLGDIIYNVSPGILGECKQDVAMMNTKRKHCCVLGPVDKKATVTPDVDSILDNINQL